LLTSLYTIRNIFLFPPRLCLAFLSFLWTLLFGGFFLPGCAPIFWRNDRYLLFLKRKGWKQHCVVFYDLQSQTGKIIYQSRIPFERMILSGNELVCSLYRNGDLHYLRINLNDGSNRIEHLFEASPRHLTTLLPKTVGVLSTRRICVGETCYRQITMTTKTGSEVLEDNILDDDCSALTMSHDERFLSFSTSKDIYINDIATRKQLFFSEGKAIVFNCDYNNNLLAYSYENGYFIILNPITSERKEIKLPDEFVGSPVTVGAISPQGSFIAYNVYRKLRGTATNTSVVLHSLHSNNYKVLTQMASVYGIGWSENEKYISISGIAKRDLFDIAYMYKMRNSSNHHKEVYDIDGGLIMESSTVKILEE